MARIIGDESAGQADSLTQHHGKVIDAGSSHSITLPGHEYITDSQILRDGQDLILKPAHGEEITIQNYFTADPAPILNSADGVSSLTHDLVDSFVKPLGGVQYAQNGTLDNTMNDSSPIGVIKESSGEATITHANGVSEKAVIGTPIYEGDIVETKDHGAVNITFVDNTTFAVSENAKMAIDQYVFDPTTQHGENNFSVLRGVFVFTSGLIGHADPDDVKISTPVGSIGIRGTTIMGTIDPSGDSHVSVVEGAIVVSNAAGETTLSQQFETVQLNGMNEPMTSEGVLSATVMAENYNVLRTVSGPLFSTFDDLAEPTDQPDSGALPDGGTTTPSTDTTTDSAAPVNKSESSDSETTENQTTTLSAQNTSPDQASLDSGFDTSAGTTESSVFSTTTVSSTALSGGTTSTSFVAPQTTTTSSTNTLTSSATVSATTSTGTSSGTVTGTGTTSTASGTTGTGAGSTATLPPLALNFSTTTIATTSLAAGLVVATVKTTIAYSSVTYSWSNLPTDGASNPLFTLTQNADGSASIVLTTAGANTLTNNSDTVYAITASLPDGRTATANSDILVQDPAAPAPNYDLLLNDVIAGTGGTFIPSVSASSQHGYNVTALGDYNHDGKANYGFVDNTSAGGILYIDDRTGNNYSINLSNTPFSISDTTNMTLAFAGDFNRDGKGDIIIGAPQGGGFSNGDVYILSGASPTTPLLHITGFNNTAPAAFGGYSIDGVGDFNGDGFNDIIIGAPETSGSGHAYVIFGSNAGTIDVNSLSPAQGFVITGGAGSALGADVAGIGDFNKDGFSDFAVSAPGSNNVVVHFGNSAGTDTNQLTITGLSTGAKTELVSFGDMSGDGISDFGITDSITNSLYVFKGNTLAGAGSVAIGSAAYTLHGGAGSTLLTAGSAGDFNGDGRDDALLAIRNGSTVDIYVVYGSSSLAGSIDVSTLGNNSIFHMSVDLTSSQFNLANPTTDAVHFSLSSAGDLNGDGLGDLVIGVSTIDSNGGAHSNDGGVILINGRIESADLSTGTVTNATTASSNGQSLIGTTGNDTLYTSTFIDNSFHAGAGNDIINLSSSGARMIDGGDGMDTLNLFSSGIIDLSAMTSNNLKNIETIQMQTTGTTLKLGIDDIFSLMQQSADGILRITDQTGGGVGNGTTSLQIISNGSGFSLPTGTTGVVSNGETYTDYAFGNYHLYVDANVDSTTVV